MTSKKNKESSGTQVSELFIPVLPKPASRPRISKFGNYYTKSYADYRKETWMFLKTIKDKYSPCESTLFHVDMEFICYKPKKPSKPYPRYDVDNLVKAVLDSITYAKMFYKDDVQVISITANKRYQVEGENYGTKIKFTRK